MSLLKRALFLILVQSSIVSSLVAGRVALLLLHTSPWKEKGATYRKGSLAARQNLW